MAEHILKHVPPSLNEGVFDSPGYESDELILAVRAALLRGRESAEKARTSAEARFADLSLTEVARHMRVKADSHKITKGAVDQIQKVSERLAESIKKLESFLQGPVVPNQLAAVEVRTALAHMTREQRRKIILNSLADRHTMAAVLRAPSWLVGLDDVEQTDLRLSWQRHAHPAEAARLAALQSAAEHLGRGGHLLVGYVLHNPVVTDRAEQFQRRADDAVGAALH